MSALDHKSHNQAVYEFFAKCAKEDPERYREVCDRYPIVSGAKLRRIKELERTVGLLGLQPSRIATGTADVNRHESVYDGDDIYEEKWRR